ncbi:MAG: hypothetical protein ACYTFT_11495, partial [Planctomycetota bacterium]|jgi:hypothetical protein
VRPSIIMLQLLSRPGKLKGDGRLTRGVRYSLGANRVKKAASGGGSEAAHVADVASSPVTTDPLSPAETRAAWNHDYRYQLEKAFRSAR